MEENHLKMNDAKTEKTPWITLKLEIQKFTRHQKLNFLEYIWMKN